MKTAAKKSEKFNMEPCNQHVATLFKQLKKTKDITSVPTMYGTKQWPNAAMAELGPKAGISPGEAGKVVIQIPGSKEIKVSQQEFWEISCLNACEKHNSYYLDNKAEIWKYERPWQALQEYNLRNFRAQLTKPQENVACSILEKYAIAGDPIPFISSLTYGWPWMFESAPGVWPPEEIINPRSVLYDPLLGIMVFQDVLDFLKENKEKPLELIGYELSLCVSRHVQNQTDKYTDVARELLQGAAQNDIEEFVRTSESVLSLYHTQFETYMTLHNPEEVFSLVDTLLLGACRYLEAKPKSSIARALAGSKLLKAYKGKVC